MRPSLLAVLFLISLQKALAQGNNDLAREELKGRVKTVTELLFYVGQKEYGMKTVDKYDRKGNRIEQIHDDYELELHFRKSFKYDTANNGNIIRVNEFDDSGTLVHTIDYKYDSQDHLAAEEDHRKTDDKNAVNKKEYYYDSNGHKAREKNYIDGMPDYTTDYTYDDRGRITSVKSYDRNDKVTMIYDYHYYTAYEQWEHCEKQAHGIRTHVFRSLDTQGTLTEQTTYLNDFSKETKETYTGFDKMRNWLKLTVTGTVNEHYSISRKIEYYRTTTK